MDIGSKIKELRTDNKLSQMELGRMLHTTGACISSWETGRTEPNIEQIKALAALFKINPMSLMGEVKHDFEISGREMNFIIEYRNAPKDIQDTIERLLTYAKRINQLNDLMKGE